jgi:hypothetical protein
MADWPEWMRGTVAAVPDAVRGPSTQVYDPQVVNYGSVPFTPGAPRDVNYLSLTPAQRAQFQRFQYDRSNASNEPRLEQDVGRMEFQEGTPPNRIPWLWKDYIGAWAGLAQHGLTQWNYRLYLRPPGSANFQSRESKSVRGITQRATTFTGMQRIPAVYVPSSVG